ncbi:hypothetical protein IEQ34_015614 [Dendrobium chrysotoxum]|uniref:Uncharacterized protein n=1 Tax=Dendrobium chrysotoxum TaxID=161865 RepID=A0AAV7GJB8_DENCH|nr:hypothetical protein IEQ34_015614 [Dendrobium chrysotoxum]
MPALGESKRSSRFSAYFRRKQKNFGVLYLLQMEAKGAKILCLISVGIVKYEDEAKSGVGGYLMDPQKLDMTDLHSASKAEAVRNTTPTVSFDSISQFVSLVIFLRLKPPRFDGVVEPIEVEDRMMRLVKIFYGIQCPTMRKVQLVVFLLDVYKFLRGLQNSLRQPLILFHITDFFELIERDCLIENDLLAT